MRVIASFFLAAGVFLAAIANASVAAPEPKDKEKKVDKLKRPDLKAKEWKKQDSGLELWDEKIGEGEAVKKGATVKVHYTGWLTDDKETIFDSSVKRNEPIEFSLGQVIDGWKEGIPGMKPGGMRLLKIPPELAYGARGAGKDVPPNATLIFRVELLK
jgi:FKBP-type peptidyl-prolyl cis-trans isomerase